MSIPTPTKEKTKWPLVGEEKELFVDFALGHRDTQIRSRIMFSQKVEIFRSCYNFEERKSMGLHICKEHLSKEADFPVIFPTLTSKEVAAEVKSIKQKCRDNLASAGGTSEQAVFALLDRINSHVIKTEIAPLFFASTMYEEYTNALGLYQIKNMNVARTTYPPVVMLDTLFADFKMEMESASGPSHHHGVSLGASLSWQGGRGSPTASSIGDETSQSCSSTGDHSPTSNQTGKETKTSGRTSTGKLFRMKSKILKKSTSVDRLAEISGGTGSEKDNLSSSPNSFSSPEKAGTISTTATFYPTTTTNAGNTLTPPSNLVQSPTGGSISNSSGSANSANSSMSSSRQGFPSRRKSTPHPRASSNLLFNFAPTSPSISIADDSLQPQAHSAEALNCPKNVKVRLDATKQGSGDSYTTSAVAVFKERDIFMFSTYRRSPENVRKESAMFGADYARGTTTTHAFVCDMSGKMYGAQSQSPERYEDKAVLVCRKEKKLKTNDAKMEEYKVLAMTSFGVFEFPIECAETPVFQSSNLTNEIANYFSTVHSQKLSLFKEFKLKKLAAELDALERNLIDGLKIKNISIGIVSRQNTFEDSVEMLLKNRTISPAYDAFVTALAGPFDAFDHANKHVKSKAHSNNNDALPTFDLPAISTPTSPSSKYDRSTDRSASPEPAARANKSSSDVEVDGRVGISPRGAVTGTTSSSMLSPTGTSQGLLSASKSSAGSATHSRESKEKSADSSSETSKSPILISNASTRHENMWCDDGSDPEDSGEGILLLAEDVAAKRVMSSTHDNLPGRVRREWNGVEMFWNLAPKLTKEEMRRYVGNCTSLIIFDEVGLNDPFDPLYLRLGKVTNFIVVVKPVVDESSASGFAYRIGYFIHYEQRWTPLNQSLSQAETLQDVERQIFNVNFGPAIQKNFVFQDTYIKPLLNLLINNATTAAYKHHHQVHLLARQPASALIASFVKSHVPEAMK